MSKVEEMEIFNLDQLSEKVSEKDTVKAEKELNHKLIFLLGLNNSDKKTEEMEQYFRMFDFENDIKMLESEKDKKTIYTFSLNQSGIDKIKAIKYLRILEEILIEEMNKITKKSDKKIELTAQKNTLKNLENGFFKKEDIEEIVENLELKEEFGKRTDGLIINFEYELEIDILEEDNLLDEKSDTFIISATQKKILFLLAIPVMIGLYASAYNDKEVEFLKNMEYKVIENNSTESKIIKENIIHDFEKNSEKMFSDKSEVEYFNLRYSKTGVYIKHSKDNLGNPILSLYNSDIFIMSIKQYK